MQADIPYALLINNLGAVTPLEMSIIAREALNASVGKQFRLVIGPGLLMTSLNMYGFSLSILPLTPELEKILRAPVGPIA